MRLSASDLMRFTGCEHATAFDVEHAHGRGPKPDGEEAETAIVQKKGLEHEARELAKLKASGLRVIELPSGGDIAAMAPGLRDVLLDGPDVVYQGPLSGSLGGSPLWGGRSDFLHRVERPSALGSFSYEVSDTKLKREVAPTHVLQLTVYSDLLAQVQGVGPTHARVVVGTGEAKAVRLNDYSAYSRRLRHRLERFVADPWQTRSTPCAECAICRWQSRCENNWKETDSLFGVANITKGQVAKLEAAGIRTMEALALHEGGVHGLANPTLEKIARQARLQHARKTGEPHFELRSPQSGRGFALLPEPHPEDMFYDIEGDPHHPDGGLEYLHGVQHRGAFTAFWAHDRKAEAEALHGLLAYFEERLTGHPGAHIYHYAPYEITALRRLVSRHRIGEVFLDRLLRERRFVDLYTVVRGAIVASEENYSIKSLEKLYYGESRSGDVTTSMGSVVAYHEWLDTGVQKILDDIEAYNAIDCDSTEKLRDWLAEVRPQGDPWPVTQGEADEDCEKDQTEIEEVRSIVAGVPEPERRESLFDIGMFHRREDKPAWWAVFDSVAKDSEELLDALDALGGLVALGPAELAPTKKSLDRRYAFPVQDTKLRDGKTVTISVDGNLEDLKVVSIDRKAGLITLRAGKDKGDWLADHLSLHPAKPYRLEGIKKGLRAVLADQANGREFTAVDDLLARRPPRLTGGATRDILAGRDPVEGTVATVLALDGGVLPVQGPPGTGKTYVAARAILALVARGVRVGVAASSHEAIRNLLRGCIEAAQAEGWPILPGVAHKGSEGGGGYEPDFPVHWTTRNEDRKLGRAAIVGSTAWFFSRDDQVGQFDCLFVDEAGQMSLANLLAMGRAARNIVLVGDPQQLPQVIQGAHPGAAGMSCLEWLLGEEATVPPDRGIFLAVSRRMHPEVCSFVSERSYQGRLTSHASTMQQGITGTSWPVTGAQWVPVEHSGRAQVSEEEVRAIVEAARDLLGGRWTDRNGETQTMTPEDVIVVAPYNAQVNELRDALDAEGLNDIRVGTVDKFQGQEAAAALVSMTASSADESPKGMEFLLSLNRINVAISRAKALALVFGSDRLLDAACRNLEQMRLANTLCALAEHSTLNTEYC